MNIGELDKTARTIWAAGRELQSGLPRYEGLCLRQLVEKTGLSTRTVAVITWDLESKGLVTSRKIGTRRKKGTIRFVTPRKSA